MKYKHLAFIVLACTTTSAFADWTLFPTCQPDWTGIYIGAQGGYGWGHAKWNFPFDQYYTSGDDGGSFTTKPSGGLGGGQLGLIYQYGNIVAGLEVAYLAGGINQHNTGSLSETFPEDTFTTTIDNMRSFTGRLGFACYCWQVYAKGGAAAAETTIHALSGFPGPGVVGDVSHTQSGWTAGVGVDYRLAVISPNLFVGLEYDYVSLNNRTFAGTTTGTVVGLPFEVQMRNVNFNTVTAHINVKFL